MDEIVKDLVMMIKDQDDDYGLSSQPV